ncbi:hypothetical protein [Pseudorhodoferax sp.]|uniref:hypothetical protein n=1 Tax=Pseudorhodoferax sp. TaxID=1993553 RepID=UPI002DD66296|nr:hypothetical protein [Pseudorhodoferax sp.]
MSAPDGDDWVLPTPAFDATQALVHITRALRELKLTERGQGFELQGRTVLQITREGEALTVRLARRRAGSGEWDRLRVAGGADQRKLLDEVKRRLDRWQHED